MSTGPTGQKPRDPKEDNDYEDWKRGTGTSISTEAYEYGQKISAGASSARVYLSDRVSATGGKFKDLQNVDYRQVADDAKNYVREKPGRALLISAAAGFMIGLLINSSRRR